MSNEAHILLSLRITKNNLLEQTQPTSFTDDVSGTKGPTPGAITVTTLGTDVDFSQLTTPGWVWIENLEASGGNYVEWGIWDPETSKFYPVGELTPGKIALFKFSRNFAEEYAGTGTGTTGPTNRLRIKANKASCIVSVKAFEA